MKGEVVGIEQRAFGAGEAVARRSVFAFRSGAKTSEIWSSALVRCEASGCSVTEDGERRWYPGVIIPELWPPLEPRRGPVLDAGGLSGDVTIAADSAGVLSWVGDKGRTTVWLDPEGRPARARFGAVEWQREKDRPSVPEPVDVGQLLSIPAPRVSNARRSMIGEYLVDGRPVRVDVPLWAELPPEREAVRAAVVEVAEAVRDAFVPGDAGSAGLFGAQRGDCTEHALALVEALRARGYAAQTAAGYVYVDGPDGGGRLVLHAWVEVEIGGRWVAADAALRQFPADATHLRIGDWIEDLPIEQPAIEIRSIR